MLADEFFLIAHDDRDGRPRLHSRAIELGLAAGLLGELVLDRRVDVLGPMLRLLSDEPPVDALSHTTLATLLSERQHREVRTWLAFLGQRAVDDVGQRLARANVVRRTESRRMLRTSVRYVPVDPNLAAGREVRLHRMLTGREAMSLSDATLAGLVAATGLTRQVLWDGEATSMQYLTQIVASLPPPLHDLVVHTEAAVGDAVLSQRA